MKDEIQHSLKSLKQGIKRLQEVARKKHSDIVQDATIQRFEFTFELLWKAVKLVLEDKGVLIRTPKDAFKEAFRLDWINDEEVFLKMLDARNKMSHVYDEAEARQIYKEISQRFLKPIQKLSAKLESLQS